MILFRDSVAWEIVERVMGWISDWFGFWFNIPVADFGFTIGQLWVFALILGVLVKFLTGISIGVADYSVRGSISQQTRIIGARNRQETYRKERIAQGERRLAQGEQRRAEGAERFRKGRRRQLNNRKAKVRLNRIRQKEARKKAAQKGRKG